MKTINYVIIEVDQQYNNEVELNNGTNLIVNTTIESVEHVNRIGKVIATPEGIVLNKGDEILFHHNILRKKNSQKGNEVQSDYHIEGNMFFVPLEEIFMYRKDSESWESLDPFCFIKPIEKEVKEETDSGLALPSSFDSGYNGMKENIGEVVYPNKALEEFGISKGDMIYFSDNSEYEFEVDGEILYRMKTSDVLARLEYEGIK